MNMNMNMSSEKLVQGFKSVEKKMRQLDEEMVVLLRSVQDQKQDPLIGIVMKAVQMALQEQANQPPVIKVVKPRGKQRRFSMAEKQEILAAYDKAIASGVWGAGVKTLKRYELYGSSYVTIWRKELARKNAPVAPTSF